MAFAALSSCVRAPAAWVPASARSVHVRSCAHARALPPASAHGSALPGAPLTLLVRNEIAMAALAEALADRQPRLGPGDLLCLFGSVGAGKSCFSRALIRHVMDDARLPVPSPTFLLQQTYELGDEDGSPLELHHFDLYRLASGSEPGLHRLGLAGCFQQGVCLVEWAERLPHALLPPDRLIVRIEVLEDAEQGRGAGQSRGSGHEGSSEDGDADTSMHDASFTDRRARLVSLRACGARWERRLHSLRQYLLSGPSDVEVVGAGAV